MAILFPIGVSPKNPNLIPRVNQIPRHRGDVAFESTLELSAVPSWNHRLRIILNLFLKRKDPTAAEDIVIRSIASFFGKSFPAGTQLGIYQDPWGGQFPAAGWRDGDWGYFKSNFLAAANRWNRRFWLIPPADFDVFDFSRQGARYRPNICCNFETNIVGTSGSAHWTMDVFKLASPVNFRANAMSIKASNWRDATMASSLGQTIREHKRFNTVTHEIGHAIGLDHVGISRSLPLCMLAMQLDGAVPQDLVPILIPDLLNGGGNAHVCYGEQSAYDDANDVMGMGGGFGKQNAKPWLDRLPHHLSGIKTDIAKWTVATEKVFPKRMGRG